MCTRPIRCFRLLFVSGPRQLTSVPLIEPAVREPKSEPGGREEGTGAQAQGASFYPVYSFRGASSTFPQGRVLHTR